MNRKERRQLRRDEKRATRAAQMASPAKGLLQKAKANLDAGNLAVAEQGFLAVTKADPLDAEAFHMLALIAYQDGRLEQAGEMILEATTRNDDDASLHANCGAIMNLLGRPLEAEAASRHSIDLNSEQAEAHNNLAVALEVQGRLDEALKAGTRSIEINPDYPEAHINLGNLKLRMTNVAGAIESYREAIRSAPDNAMARANLATALREAGDLDAAESECRKAIEIKPGYAEAHNSLANVFIAREDWEAAQKSLEVAIKARENYLDAHLNLAGVLYKSRKIEDAIGKYQKIIENYDSLPEAHTGLGVVLLAAGRLDEAVENFKTAVKAKPTLGQAQYNLATAVGKDMTEVEISGLRELLAGRGLGDQDRARIHFSLGEIFDQKGNWESAFTDFEAGNQLMKDRLARANKLFDADAFDKRVNKILSYYTPDLLAKRKDWGDATEQPVFIVGMPRSGTTLVEQILTSHLKVFGKGELEKIRYLSEDDKDCVRPFDEQAMADKAQAYLATLRAGVAEDAARIIDKMPVNWLYLGLIQSMLPCARIIHCCRDPLDTGMSCFRQYFSSPHAWACDLGSIGRFHRSTDRAMDFWKKRLSLPILEINYEDMIADQEATSRRMIEFVGLDWDPACLEFHKTEGTVTTASNWQVRKPLYSSAIGRAKGYEKFLDPLKKGLNL
ncbi:MAG: tetratricopeptide repeat protein [Rhodospirillales bacterium]|nr:tetratricopeptide repeat protein [Rhodospirillales bacterium]